METIRIQADAIIASPSVVHLPGQIVVQNGRIVACSADCSERADLHLPNSMLSAGLVNAHTHLEFSDLQQPFAPGCNFPEWIAAVIRHRRLMSENGSSEEYMRRRQLTLQAGLEESRQAGVVLVGDIVTRPWSPDDLLTRCAGVPPAYTPHSPIGSAPTRSLSHAVPIIVRNNLSTSMCLKHLASSPWVFAFPEIIGLDEARFAEAAQWAMHLAAIESPSDPIWQIGLSPHAPYSIHFPTAEKALGSNFTRQLVTAMHVAESLDERQWLEFGSGPFRDVFERLGIPADAPRASITHVIRWLASRPRGLLIHGNYLTDAETELVAGSALAIVYCPRTHRHFGHTEYPLRRFIDSQINVVLGTDSRASNPDLDLWSEVIALRASHAWVSPAWAYGAVTQRSAAALGVEQHFGSLLAGRVASINVSSFDSTVPPIELLDELTTRTRPFTPLTDLLASLHQL